MRWFRKGAEGDPLAVSMSGVRLGDRVLVVGAGDPLLLAGVAVKSGLTGRACVVDEAEGAASAAAAAAEHEGALVEAITSRVTMLPLDEGSFDVVILRDVLPALTPDRRSGCVSEAHRVLRPGGRCMVIERAPRAGLGALIGRTEVHGYPGGGGASGLLEAQGFRAVRTLAEREGFVFVEGVRANA